MHIEQISGNGVSYLQALVRFPRVPVAQSWWNLYQHRIAAVAGLQDISSAFRLCVRTDGRIDRMFSAIFDPTMEQPTRRFFAYMSLLGGYASNSVDFPDTAGQFDNWAADFPERRCRMMPSPLQVGSAWLACDFRVAAHLDLLIREAQAFSHGFGYQVHFRSFAPSAEQRMRIGRNAIALRSVIGIPPDLLLDQERQTRRFHTTTLLVEEIVAAEGQDASRWLAGALDRVFRANAVGVRVAPLNLEFEKGKIDCALMMHSSYLREWTDDDLVCSQAEDEKFRIAALAYRPADDLASRAGSREEPDPEPPPLPYPPGMSLPPTFDGPGHIFISYKRTDFMRIAPIMERLALRQQPIWYDRGNVAGDEWDVVLERKVFEAGMLLFFLSRESANSKYCQREVRLADTNNKPLLIVVLDQVELPYGLKFLSLVQQINVEDHEFNVLLDTAIGKRLTAVSK
jgi:TIR domain